MFTKIILLPVMAYQNKIHSKAVSINKLQTTTFDCRSPQGTSLITISRFPELEF